MLLLFDLAPETYQLSFVIDVTGEKPRISGLGIDFEDTLFSESGPLPWKMKEVASDDLESSTAAAG